MTPRSLVIFSILAAILVLMALLTTIALLPTTPRHDLSITNPLRGRPNMVDRLVMIDSGDDFSRGALEHVSIDRDTPARIVLDDRRQKTYPRYGYWTSPQMPADFAFTELIPSWNIITPANTGVRFQVRTRDRRSGRWSPWLYVGQWGRTMIATQQDRKVVQFDHGAVYTDVLLLDRPADAMQIRAALQSFDVDASVNPSIRRITIAYSGRVDDDRLPGVAPQPVRIEGQWARDLGVPFRAQRDSTPALKSHICSPTSTTMVMAYWGVDRPIVENALAIYDAEYDLFGNWSRATQRAAELGLDAWIARFRNWDQVKAMIALGTPVIATVAFEKGQFPGSVLDETRGHLIVVRGFKDNGDVICNDPASKEKGNGVVYKADELGRAWFENAGGVGYVIHGPGQRPAHRD